MTKQVQRRRGTAAQHTSFTGAEGEISVNTTNKSVHVHDGTTAGGVEAARADLNNVSDATLNNALSGNTVPSLTITSADINGGTIDGTVIGGSTRAAISGTTLEASGNVDFKGGDISFYEDTGTTPKFFWDASAEALGIGTAPSYELHVANTSTSAHILIQANSTSESRLWFGDTASNTVGRIEYGHASDYMDFFTNNSQAMRIDSSGNVGIGTSSPTAIGAQTTVHINGASGSGIRLSDGSNNGFLDYADSNGGMRLRANTGSLLVGTNASEHTTFITSATERMRITSGGTLLVGTTSIIDVSTTSVTGHDLRSSGASVQVRDGGTVQYINRLTSDGDIVSFRKDGTSVGSIGTDSGSTYYTGGSGSGVKMKNAAVVPTNGDGVDADGTESLGQAIVRWKDLYLSGGVYLGGIGSANLLDDYEEGTWTPSIPGLTATVADGSYTKVGDIVTAHFQINTSSATDSAGAAISGLPFTAKNNTQSGRSAGYFSYNPSGSYFTLLFTSGTTEAAFREDSSGSTVTRTTVSGNFFWGTIIYKAF